MAAAGGRKRPQTAASGRVAAGRCRVKDIDPLETSLSVTGSKGLRAGTPSPGEYRIYLLSGKVLSSARTNHENRKSKIE